MIVENPLEYGLPYAAIALNYTLPKYFESVWKNANVRICVDGGSNKVHDYFWTKGIKDYLPPDHIVGDLTSIRPDVQALFEKRGTKITKILNKRMTDSEKAILMLSQMKYKDSILILGAFGGRFDQTVNLIHSALSRPELKIFLADDSNFSNWIFPGKTKIKTPQKLTTHVCGLIPLVKPVSPITKGLRWDMDGTLELKMGEFISSSNEVGEGVKEILVEVKDPIFWTIEAKKIVDTLLKKKE